jgi:hypothetical protein
MKNKKDLLSTLWIFLTLNYLYCDLMGLMDANLLKQYLTGSVDGLEMTESFLFYAALLMEIPIAMVLLSKVLPHKANAWANIVAGVLKTMAMIATFFVGTATQYYTFFATIEIATSIFIVGYAWKWLKEREPALA